MNLANLIRSTTDFVQTGQTAHSSGTEQLSAKTLENINRQIRALTPGQTILGQVLSKEGSDVQIRTLSDVMLQAKVDEGISLNVGQMITFQVKNNGQALTLNPLFTNVASGEMATKALQAANIPVGEKTASMTQLMMQEGMPIDQETLGQVYREVVDYANAELMDIINLHKLGVPVTAENLTQAAAYRNFSHQLSAGITEVADELPALFDSMSAESLPDSLLARGRADGAQATPEQALLSAKAALFSELLSIVGGEEGSDTSQVADGILLPTGQGDGQPDTAALPFSQEGIEGQTAQAGQLTGLSAPSMTQLASILQELPEEQSAQLLTLLRETMAGQEAGELTSLLPQALVQAQREGNTELLQSLFDSESFVGLLKEKLTKSWTIRPEDVSDPEKVQELYDRLQGQLKSFTGALEQAGLGEHAAARTAQNLSSNLDFMSQLNQAYTYVQLPLRLQQQDTAHGELYVYTNRRNLARKDGEVSALLHLDMEHLGPMDVYVSLRESKVSTRFYVQDDAILDLISEHMDILTKRLDERGYDVSCKLQLRAEAEESEETASGGGMQSLLAKDGKVPLVSYAFDMRA